MKPLSDNIFHNIKYLPIDIYVTPCNGEALSCVHTAL